MAMAAIANIIAETNKYLRDQDENTNLDIVASVARWVTLMVDIFGLDSTVSAPYSGRHIGWSNAATAGLVGGTADPQEIALPYVRVLSSFRDEVRKIAMSVEPEFKRQLLQLCDKV